MVRDQGCVIPVLVCNSTQAVGDVLTEQGSARDAVNVGEGQLP